MNTKEACPAIALHTLYYFFTYGAKYFGFLGIILGGFLVAEGGKRYRITMFLSGFILTIITVLIFFFTVVVPYDSPMWSVWLVLTVATGMGSGIGFAA